MLSVIESEAVLDAAREMNRRDVLRIELENGIREKDDVDTELIEADDDAIWARTEGVDGLRGVGGDRLKMAGSIYAYGPYPRNRRVLADVALAAGWGVEKARDLERRCVRAMARHFAALESKTKPDDGGLLDPDQPRHNGKPFTFQHISWSFLTRYILSEMSEMDPGKTAAVKAAVLDRYESNSIKGRKVLPAYDRGTKRISDGDVPVSGADLERAQDALDREARYRAARHRQLHDAGYMPPDQVKRRLKAFIVTREMSEADFCSAIGVTEDQLAAFIRERKMRPLLESRVFHNAQAYMNGGKEVVEVEVVDKGPPPKKRRRRLL